jgi:glutaconate CoA-transferase subunit B
MRSGMNDQPSDFTSEEMMTIAAARRFRNGAVCFVGVGLPSIAACLARELHAPNITLVYESGAIGARPSTPPLSIADPELAETATSLVTVPEIFNYWLQGDRIDVGVLGAAQIDRFGNLNSTVIGDYASPKVRLPGAGGAPRIAAHAREIVVIVRHSSKAFVSRLDFLTTAVRGPVTVVTDLGILQSEAGKELVLIAVHSGVGVDQVRAATGWELRVADEVNHEPLLTRDEILALRALQ